MGSHSSRHIPPLQQGDPHHLQHRAKGETDAANSNACRLGSPSVCIRGPMLTGGTPVRQYEHAHPRLYVQSCTWRRGLAEIDYRSARCACDAMLSSSSIGEGPL